jgi:molybdopterin-synthase adenylyltransferase
MPNYHRFICMNDQQLLRYSRQILLPQVDIAGQQKLLCGKVLMVGAGGLGSPAAMYLAAAGVGLITIYDSDQVDLSNLQRQIAHGSTDIGVDKVISSRETLKNLNPEVEVQAFARKLSGDELLRQAAAHDVVLDCSDNFATRFAVNRACVLHKTPLVSGAAIGFEGQISVFTPGQNQSPCYNCLYQGDGEDMQNCARNGVIAPIVGIIGSMQALEALKILMGIGETLNGRLMLLDGLAMQWQTLRLNRNPDCPCCGDNA